MPAILKGIIFDSFGNAFTTSFTRKSNKIYRYYVNIKALKYGYDECVIKNFPAEELENFIITKIRELVTTPEILHKIHTFANKKDGLLSLDYVRNNMHDFNTVWEHLFPIEKARIVQLVVDKITIAAQEIQIKFHPNELLQLCKQLGEQQPMVV